MGCHPVIRVSASLPGGGNADDNYIRSNMIYLMKLMA